MKSSSFIHIVVHVDICFVIGGAGVDASESKLEGDKNTFGMVTPYCCVCYMYLVYQDKRIFEEVFCNY